jgi:hypothetical protein
VYQEAGKALKGLAVNTTSFVVDTGKNTVGAGAALAMSIKGLSFALLLLC